MGSLMIGVSGVPLPRKASGSGLERLAAEPPARGIGGVLATFLPTFGRLLARNFMLHYILDDLPKCPIGAHGHFGGVVNVSTFFSQHHLHSHD